MKHKQTHREQTCGCQRGGGNGRGKDWEFGVSRCKLLYIERINNKVLLYSTGNYIKYLVINYNGKEKINILLIKKNIHSTILQYKTKIFLKANV